MKAFEQVAGPSESYEPALTESISPTAIKAAAVALLLVRWMVAARVY